MCKYSSERNLIYHALPEHEVDFTKCINRHSGDEIIFYKKVEEQPLCLSLYYPKGYQPSVKYPVFVMVHGGGWTSRAVFEDQRAWAGDHLGYLARYYADKGYISVSIDYRLMQENGQTDGSDLIDLYEDCMDALIYLKSYEEQYGLDFSKAVLLGESAGGYLAGAMATLPYKQHIKFEKLILVNAITHVMDSGWGARVPENSAHPYLAGRSRVEMAKLLSPAYQITEDIPDTLLIHGIEDTIVHPSHSQVFYDEMRLKGKNVELHMIEDTQHAFLLAEYVKNNPTARRATGLGVEIIDQWLFE